MMQKPQDSAGPLHEAFQAIVLGPLRQAAVMRSVKRQEELLSGKDAP